MSKNFIAMLYLVAALGLAACDGDDGASGPAGPAGADGANGADGADGANSLLEQTPLASGDTTTSIMADPRT